jgi:hypothetical protein
MWCILQCLFITTSQQFPVSGVVFNLLLEPIKPSYAAGILFSATFSIKKMVFPIGHSFQTWCIQNRNSTAFYNLYWEPHNITHIPMLRFFSVARWTTACVSMHRRLPSPILRVIAINLSKNAHIISTHIKLNYFRRTRPHH